MGVVDGPIWRVEPFAELVPLQHAVAGLGVVLRPVPGAVFPLPSVTIQTQEHVHRHSAEVRDSVWCERHG